MNAIPKALLSWTVLILLRIPLVLLGLVVVPIGLLFAKELPTERKVKWERWRYIRMPKLFWLWDNIRDGAMGDVRGDYWIHDYPDWIAQFPKAEFALKSWYWLALRNPTNNTSRFLLACDLRKYQVRLLGGTSFISDLAGGYGWQFCSAGNWYFGFYLVKKLPFTRRLLAIRLGYKLEPRYNSVDWSYDPEKALKGFTFKIAAVG